MPEDMGQFDPLEADFRIHVILMRMQAFFGSTAELSDEDAMAFDMQVLQIAGFKAMTDLIMERNPADLEHPARIRRMIIKDLWLDGRWTEPWISMINQEFPGDPLSVGDIEEFITESGEHFAVTAESTAEASAVWAEIADLLFANGFIPTGSDDRLITGFIMLLGLRRRGRSSASDPVKQRIWASEMLHRRYEAPHHAWIIVLDKFFPI